MESGAHTAIVLAFWVTNQVLGVFNSWSFREKGFRFPCFVSACQSTAFGFFVLVAAGCGSSRFRQAMAPEPSSSSAAASSSSSVVSVAFWSSGGCWTRSLTYSTDLSLALLCVWLVRSKCAPEQCESDVGIELRTLNADWTSAERSVLVRLHAHSLYALRASFARYLPLSMNQLVRATIPVVTAVVGAYHGVIPSRAEFASLGCLVAGVLLVIIAGVEVGARDASSSSSLSSSSQVMLGLGFCLLGTIAAAMALVATGRALASSSSRSLDVAVVRLAWRIVPWNLAFAVPLFLAFELEGVKAYYAAAPGLGSPVIWVTSISAGLASVYNLAHFLVNGKTGPVMTTVLGQVKIVSLVIISKYFLENDGRGGVQVDSIEVVGFAVAIVGFAAYGLIRATTREAVDDHRDSESRKQR